MGSQPVLQCDACCFLAAWDIVVPGLAACSPQVCAHVLALQRLMCCCCCRLISYIYPSRNQELVEKLQAKKATVIGECVLAQSAHQAAACSVVC
jgi:hypothetical protein